MQTTISGSERTQAPAMTPSPRLMWALVAAIAVLGVALVGLERGLEGEPVPDFIAGPELDLDAVAELDRRGIDPCPGLGAPVVPADLAARAPLECDPFDGHGGIGYPIVATVLAALGTGFYTWRRNRVGLYLALIVGVDMLGAVAGAYAFKTLVIDPGSLPLGRVAGFVGGQTWIAMLVVLVPLLILSIPTGRLRSPRWRLVMGAALVAAAVLALTQALHPFLIGPVLNPIAAPWSVSTANTVFEHAILLWMVAVAGALASLVVRAGSALSEAARRRSGRPSRSAGHDPRS